MNGPTKIESRVYTMYFESLEEAFTSDSKDILSCTVIADDLESAIAKVKHFYPDKISSVHSEREIGRSAKGVVIF